MSVPGATFPQEVAFLYRLARTAPKGAVLVELGTYLGRTLVALAAAAQERNAAVVSVDNYTYPEPCSAEAVANNLRAVGLLGQADSPPIHLIEGDSRQRPDWLADINLLFVDSHHLRAHFDAEMEAWLGQVPIGGIVACHDYDSPTWLEMTSAIQHWLFTPQFDCLGCHRRLIAFRKVSA